jgi:ABC-type lipoprotein release transport system permease subunit
MTPWTLIRRSLRFHARSHLGAVLGAAVGSAVLIGALIVGDSVRGSLREMALARLGRIHFAVASNDRLFRTQLADDLHAELGRRKLPAADRIAPALRLLGTATAADGSARANRVQVLGVEERFWRLASQSAPFAPVPEGTVVLNQALAAQLNARPGDMVLLRVPKPSRLSHDAPLAPEEDTSVAMRLTVHAIAADTHFGRFSLQANQVAPFNAFVPLAGLQRRLDIPGRANLLLAPAAADADAGEGGGLGAAALAASLRSVWQLGDAQLELRQVPGAGALELRTDRVFLDAAVTEAALAAAPQASGLLTYFVNELRVGDRATPYSMVTGIGTPIVPPDLADDEILINQWLADDLAARPGDALQLSYYVVGIGRKLAERTNRFRVRAILPMAPPAVDRALMPDFPGLTEADNCRDWDTGFPINTGAIREKDEQYWDEYRGTPKAFVSLPSAQRLWQNRFGNLTAVRYPSAAGRSNEIGAAILRALDPVSVGLSLQPVRQQALAASREALDFGQLFLGFSFFLIVAALLLLALLFQFSIEQRATEVGTFLALGFTPQAVRRMFLLEGLALSVFGTILGALGGAGYARAMLRGLSTVWRDAVGTGALGYHATAQTLAVGAVASVFIAAFTLWLALRGQGRQPAHALLAHGAEAGEPDRWRGPARRSRAGWVAAVSFVAAAGTIGWAAWRQHAGAAGVFFGAGALLLVSALALAALGLDALGRAEDRARLRLGGLGVRNATRRRRRSLAIVAMLACGSFIIVAIDANRLDALRDAGRRSSGTGGFALIGESTLPVAHDLNTAGGREVFALDPATLAGVEFVQLRVREGDDASCLNLNRAQRPRLLGLDAAALAARGAFTFAKVAAGLGAEDPWRLLDQPLPDGAVPAIADQNSILWALGRTVGDTLTYTDERGREFPVRLVAGVVNSVLQGNLLISESEFVRRFPGESGYRMFLIDAPSKQATAVAMTLTRALEDVGLELTPAGRRLAAFNAVQNTYLSTFQALGGLGLLLGSVGLGVVVLRNVLERRGELALLLAVGFRPRAVRWLVVSEHGMLLIAGLGGGVLAALVAVVPTALARAAEAPYATVAITLAAVLASGALWTWLAAAISLRGPLLAALRNE